MQTVYSHTNFLFEFMNFLKNHSHKRVFCNVSLSNLENVLQRNLNTDITRDCTSRVSGGINLENFSAGCQPKNILDASLVSIIIIVMDRGCFSHD